MKKVITRATVAGCAILVLIASGFCGFSQGTLDPNFGQGGSVLTKIQSGRDDISQSVAIQTDGKIVVAGNSFNILGYSNIGVVRYTKSGKLDKTFNLTGKKIIENGFCNVVLIQSDGKILVGGSVAIGSTTAFGLWRLNSDGSADNTFGTNGYQTVSFPAGYVICFAMALQPDGKILIGGNDGNYYAGNASLALARLTPSGALDNTFSGDGKYTLKLTKKSLACQKIILQPDGKIIAAGQLDTIIDPLFHDEFFAARLNSDGTIDNSFGTDGTVREKYSTSDVCYSAALLPDGRIVMAGMSKIGATNKSSVLCLNNNGSIDLTFGTNGWQFISFYGNAGILYTTLAQKNNKIIFVGSVFGTGGGSIGIARLNSDGVLDNTFANAGLDTFLLSTSYLGANDAVMQRNGNIVVTGYKNIGNDYFLTARILNTSPYQKTNSEEIVSSMNEVSIYPVPVSGNTIQLAFDASSSGIATISVYNAMGNLVSTPVQLNVEAGVINHVIALPDNLEGGIYFISIDLNGEKRTIQCVKE